ncbi:MAG: ergothioneine biosynthesis protein EgtB [Burkholderiaceae bacterium]|nr:ergothioneine biosynthesis protein EgtB [Burkholderiaceae bacterium]
MLPAIDGSPAELARRYRSVRAATLALTAPLSEADAQAQSMTDASPAKWHLAHTTWFFETLVLERFEPGFRPHQGAYRMLFNSYYNAIGQPAQRSQRGLITRPGLAEVLAYRRAVDERVQALLGGDPGATALSLLTLGLHHEQQHQELILTDLLHLLSCHPLLPAYRPAPAPAVGGAVPLSWIANEGGLVEIGHGGAGFVFDNEQPRHRQWLAPYALANRLVTQGEWADFVADGGYREPRWWLAAGWDWLRTHRIEHPLYWQRDGAGLWQVFSLRGLQPLQRERPVVQVSLYEADAFAAWSAAQSGLPLRLPTEAEWEHAAAPLAPAGLAEGNLLDDDRLEPQPAADRPGLQQLFGDVWEWTRSAYAPYPGFRPWDGAVGEYNGKFMANQVVLRGGSCATPRSHLRASYRNFFPTDARWQFSGLRLACDAA